MSDIDSPQSQITRRPVSGEDALVATQNQNIARRFNVAGAAVDSALSGFQSGQTEGNRDDVVGLGQSALTGFATGGPAGAAIAAASYIVGNLFGRSKSKKERARQRAEATKRVIEIAPTEAIALPYLRGRFRRELRPVYSAVGDKMPGHLAGTTAFRNTPGRQRIFGSMRTLYRAGGSNTTQYDAASATQLFFGPGPSDNEAFLLAQYDICAGPITELYAVYQDGRDIHANVQIQDQVLARLGLPNTVDPSIDPSVVTTAAGRFTPEGTPTPPPRGGNTRFINKSYLTAWFAALKRDPTAWASRRRAADGLARLRPRAKAD